MRGFLTLELLIALSVLALALGAAVLLVPGTTGVDAERAAYALSLVEQSLVRARTDATRDLRLVVASTSAMSNDGTTFTLHTEVIPSTWTMKQVQAKVGWGVGGQVALTSLIADTYDTLAGDTCNSSVTASWNVPLASNTLFGNLVHDPTGSYPITSLDAHHGRLFITVDEHTNPLPSDGPRLTRAAEELGSGVPWSEVGNVAASDDEYASVTLPPGAVSRTLYASNFNFDVPEGASIIGIAVRVERRGVGGANLVKDRAVHVVRADGSLVPMNRALASAWSTTETFRTYGSSHDLWGATDWSTEAINSPAFGAAITVEAGDEEAAAAIDSIAITVTYARQLYVTTAAPSPSFIHGLGQNDIGAGMSGVVVDSSTERGSYAYVAMNSSVAQLEVIDVADAPRVVATYHIPGATAVANTIAYRGGYAYLGLANDSSGPELIILDVRDPEHPARVGAYEVGAGVNAVTIRTDRAYLATSDSARELIALEVSDPTHPTMVGTYDAPGSYGSGQGRSVYAVGDRLLLGRSWSLTTAPEAVALRLFEPPEVLGENDMGPSASLPFGVYGALIRDHLAFMLTASNTKGGALAVFNFPELTARASVALPFGGRGTALDCEGDVLYAASVPASGAHEGQGSLSTVTSL